MKSSAATAVLLVVIIMSASLLISGCAPHPRVAEVRRENAQLKSRIATLELQVAELKERQPQPPITVNGLTLTTLEPLPELKLSGNVFKVMPRDTSGHGRLLVSGAGSAPDSVGVIEMVIGRRPIADRVWRGTLTKTGAAPATAATTTTTTTTTTSTAPAR